LWRQQPVIDVDPVELGNLGDAQFHVRSGSSLDVLRPGFRRRIERLGARGG